MLGFGAMLSRRSEVVLAPRHGNLLEPDRGVEGIGIAVWASPSKAMKETEMEYEQGLSPWLGKGVRHPIDTQALNKPSLRFKYAAIGGRLIWAKNPVTWYDLWEQTWEHYPEFAPLARRVPSDPLGSPTG